MTEAVGWRSEWWGDSVVGRRDAAAPYK